MKAIFIDTPNQRISEVEIEDWTQIAPMLDAQYFDVVNVKGKSGETLSVYVDNEGLMDMPMYFFDIGFHTPLAGKGLVLGVDYETGDGVDCPDTLEQIKAQVRWLFAVTNP